MDTAGTSGSLGLSEGPKGNKLPLLEVGVMGGSPVPATQEKPTWVDGGETNELSLVSCGRAFLPLGSECGRPGEAVMTGSIGPPRKPDFGPKLERISRESLPGEGSRARGTLGRECNVCIVCEKEETC